jgi:hypothetical protein
MTQVLDFDLSGITLRAAGVPVASAERWSSEWSVYAGEGRADPFLALDVVRGRSEPPRAAFEPKAMRSSFDGVQAEFTLPEGRARVDRRGQATIELARDLGPREFFTLMNFVRAALAWCLPARGAALLHAAGLVLDDRGFVLVGAEGSGKSTWAARGEDGGAIVLSDDVVLIDRSASGHDLLGAPFRSTHRTVRRRGRWPLAAILFPDHGSPARISSVATILAKARIAANLTFIAEAVQSDDQVAGLIDGLATRTPCARLTFPPDPSFLGPLRAWPQGG